MQPGDTPQPFVPPPPGQPPPYRPAPYTPYAPYPYPPPRPVARDRETPAMIWSTFVAFVLGFPILSFCYVYVYGDEPRYYPHQDLAINIALIGFLIGPPTVGLVARAIVTRRWRLASVAVTALLAIIVAFFVVTQTMIGPT